MICNIDDEAERLRRCSRDGKADERTTGPEYCGFVVSIWRTAKSRNPIFVRRKTLQEAMAFVEDVTGLSAIRWVNLIGCPDQLYAFTGSHEVRYGYSQYQPAKLAG